MHCTARGVCMMWVCVCVCVCVCWMKALLGLTGHIRPCERSISSYFCVSCCLAPPALDGRLLGRIDSVRWVWAYWLVGITARLEKCVVGNRGGLTAGGRAFCSAELENEPCSGWVEGEEGLEGRVSWRGWGQRGWGHWLSLRWCYVFLWRRLSHRDSWPLNLYQSDRAITAKHKGRMDTSTLTQLRQHRPDMAQHSDKLFHFSCSGSTIQCCLSQPTKYNIL